MKSYVLNRLMNEPTIFSDFHNDDFGGQKCTHLTRHSSHHLLMSIGQVGGPLLLRLYYLHGGQRKWLNAWLLTSGPILIIPIAISYAKARAKAPTAKLVVTPWLVGASAFLGCLLGLDSYLYSFGLSYLPVSVSSLLGSTQLAFTAIFAFVIVKHKFTHCSINVVALMTFGLIILGFHMNGDRPKGESDKKYVLGFFMTITAAALHEFIMPALEYTHLKAGLTITFDLVMQVQFLISMFTTLFCTVPMIINKDFQVCNWIWHKKKNRWFQKPSLYIINLEKSWIFSSSRNV